MTDRTCAFFCALTFLFVSNSFATTPYTPVAGGSTPVVGPGLITPDKVFGKEYSHDFDVEITAAGVSPDLHQNVIWDGIGGVDNGLDFSVPLTAPTGTTSDLDIDAIANHNDAMFNQLMSEDAHLIFSLDRDFAAYFGGSLVASSLPPGMMGGAPFSPSVALKNGNMIGGSGELSYELGTVGGANGPEIQGVWAGVDAVNNMPNPFDIDGVEVWGPEPGTTGDTDKLSLRADAVASGTSVFNGDGTDYITLAVIITAVESLLGDLPTLIDPESVNLDALMVNDAFGENDSFDRDPAGGVGDQIIFSIDQIPDPSDTMDGYYATGSELFVLDAAAPTAATYLRHGGHEWSHDYALATFGIGSFSMPDMNYAAFDIDAIEAVVESVVPEPSAAIPLFIGMLLLFSRRRS